MALELETTIMQEIGLGQNYRWFNGSGSCEYIRRDAMNKLPAAIRKHHDAGEQIAAPNDRLMFLAREAASWDESQYVLTKAWEIASYIIAAHLHGYYDADEFRRIEEYINKTYRAKKPQRSYSHPWHYFKERG